MTMSRGSLDIDSWNSRRDQFGSHQPTNVIHLSHELETMPPEVNIGEESKGPMDGVRTRSHLEAGGMEVGCREAARGGMPGKLGEPKGGCSGSQEEGSHLQC